MDEEDIKCLTQSEYNKDMPIFIVETDPKFSANYSLYISQMS